MKLTPRDAEELLGPERYEIQALASETLSLKDVVPYSPTELQPYVERALESSEAHRASLEAGQITPQLKSAASELALQDALGHFGNVEKLPVVKERDAHTADFKVTLDKEFMGFEPGDVVIVEHKSGKAAHAINELRDADSHGRTQLRETVQREGAGGAVCCVPREVQNHRAAMERIRADMANEAVPTKLWAGLPHDGALEAAARGAAEGTGA